MKKVRTMIGMPTVQDGHKIGRVIQVELSNDLKQMEGIWIDGGFRGTRYISSESIAMLGQVAIVVDERGKRRRCNASPLFRRAIDTNGQRLGAITGAEIDELSFVVAALELTYGIWDDLLRGRERIWQYTLNQENGDVIVTLAKHRKEAFKDEDWNDEGIGNGRTDWWNGSSGVRYRKLADGQTHEPADEKDRSLAVEQDR